MYTSHGLCKQRVASVAVPEPASEPAAVSASAALGLGQRLGGRCLRLRRGAQGGLQVAHHHALLQAQGLGGLLRLPRHGGLRGPHVPRSLQRLEGLRHHGLRLVPGGGQVAGHRQGELVRVLGRLLGGGGLPRQGRLGEGGGVGALPGLRQLGGLRLLLGGGCLGCLRGGGGDGGGLVGCGAGSTCGGALEAGGGGRGLSGSLVGDVGGAGPVAAAASAADDQEAAAATPVAAAVPAAIASAASEAALLLQNMSYKYPFPLLCHWFLTVTFVKHCHKIFHPHIHHQN